jgi:hypothetical protein
MRRGFTLIGLSMLLFTMLACDQGYCGPKSESQSRAWAEKGMSYAREGKAATSSLYKAQYYDWAAYCMKQAAAWDPSPQSASFRAELARQYGGLAAGYYRAAGQGGRSSTKSKPVPSQNGRPSPEAMATVYLTDQRNFDRAYGVPSGSFSAFRSRLDNRLSMSLDTERYPSSLASNASLYQCAVRCGLSQQQFRQGLQAMMSDRSYRDRVRLSLYRQAGGQ